VELSEYLICDKILDGCRIFVQCEPNKGDGNHVRMVVEEGHCKEKFDVVVGRIEEDA